MARTELTPQDIEYKKIISSKRNQSEIPDIRVSRKIQR
mgnify:CR=1 FL=1